MAFERLSEKLQNAFKGLTKRGKLDEQTIKETMRNIRMALLEADVNYSITKDFIKKVSDRAKGAEILSSLSPGQQVIKIVNEELISLMGNENVRLTWSSSTPTIYMLCGLQGAGKTTMAAKLANYLVKQGKKPMLAACDIYRPAAIEQLEIVAKQANVPVYQKGTQNPVKTAIEAVKEAKYYGRDVLIIDTAGRLHIDETLMDELKQIKEAVNPQEILLVVDSMTGQDAVNVAKSFDEKLTIDGVILTKLDGDARGGAALSVRAVTGKPIKFSGIGEKITDLELFHPERMASRILGMGDIVTLIEKAQEAFDDKTVEKISNKSKVTDLTLDDFLDNMQSMRKMGSLESILGMIPGMKSKISEIDINEDAIKKPEAIIRSMTPLERRRPEILNASRRKRIAAGSGTTVQDVNSLIRQFGQTKQMMKQVMRGTKGRRGRNKFNFPF